MCACRYTLHATTQTDHNTRCSLRCTAYAGTGSDRGQARLLPARLFSLCLRHWLPLPQAPPSPPVAQKRPGRRRLGGRGPLGHQESVHEDLGE
eukprot:scaffold32999_cov146-Isochrysis_galbana.AAC.1